MYTGEGLSWGILLGQEIKLERRDLCEEGRCWTRGKERWDDRVYSSSLVLGYGKGVATMGQV